MYRDVAHASRCPQRLPSGDEVSDAQQLRIDELETMLMQLRSEIEDARSKAVIQIVDYQDRVLRLQEENDQLRAKARRSG